MKTIHLLLFALLGLLVSVNGFSKGALWPAYQDDKDLGSREYMRLNLRGFHIALRSGKERSIANWISPKFELHTCNGTFNDEKWVKHLLALPKEDLRVIIINSEYHRNEDGQVLIEFEAYYDGYQLNPDTMWAIFNQDEFVFEGGKRFDPSVCLPNTTAH